MDDVRIQLAKLLQGGLQPFFTVLEAHMPTAGADADASLACMSFALLVCSKPEPLELGKWQLTRMQLGIAPAMAAGGADAHMPQVRSLFMQLDPTAQQALNLFPAITDSQLHSTR